jgi:DNA polymerase epsilon subunit 2
MARLSNQMSACELIAIIDAEPKVLPHILKRVYQALQDQGTRPNEHHKENLDPNSHLYFIDAFEMPLWHWSQERATFEKLVLL